MLITSAVFVLLVGMGTVGLRTLLAKQQVLESSMAVHAAGYIQIGGASQWIEIRGWDRTNPAILWLHGGPGAPVLPANYASFLPWEKVFTIVHWHQRGAGLTFAAAPPDAPPLTIDRMAQDGLEVAEHVRRRLHKDTIILIGHSWGSVIGTRMVQRRPDLFAVSLREAFEGSRRALFHEQQQVRVERDVPELATPAFLFQGKDDWQVSTPAAVRYFERLRAPSKEIVLFDGGHFVHVFHSDAFLNALTTKVRPLAH